MEDGEKIEKVLGEPVLEEFSGHTLAIRRNLMLVSFIAITIVIYDLAISGQFVGINIVGLDKFVVREIFFVLVAYHLIHFLWATWDHVQHWRIRITGTRLAHQTTAVLGSEDADYPSDPKQSSLYRWWFEQAGRIGNIKASMNELHKKVENWEGRIEGALAEDAKINLLNVTRSLGEIRDAIPQITREVEYTSKIIESKRIPESLSRFDRWYFRYQKSQLARWIIVEWFIPIAMGVSASYLTFPSRYFVAFLSC